MQDYINKVKITYQIGQGLFQKHKSLSSKSFWAIDLWSHSYFMNEI